MFAAPFGNDGSELHQLLYLPDREVDAVLAGRDISDVRREPAGVGGQCASSEAWAGGLDSSASEVISSWPWAAVSSTSVASSAERA